MALQEFLKMVAHETGIQDISLESVWSVYDTLFCEVSCLSFISHLLSKLKNQVLAEVASIFAVV